MMELLTIAVCYTLQHKHDKLSHALYIQILNVYLFTKIGKKYSRGAQPVSRQVPQTTLRVLNGLFTGCRLDENAGRIWGSLFGTPAPVRVMKIVPVPVKSEGSRPGTVKGLLQISLGARTVSKII